MIQHSDKNDHCSELCKRFVPRMGGVVINIKCYNKCMSNSPEVPQTHSQVSKKLAASANSFYERELLSSLAESENQNLVYF